jgi:hypothetical protein
MFAESPLSNGFMRQNMYRDLPKSQLAYFISFFALHQHIKTQFIPCAYQDRELTDNFVTLLDVQKLLVVSCKAGNECNCINFIDLFEISVPQKQI